MKCFYHLDNDGKCAGYWVRKFCEDNNIPFKQQDFVKMNYNIKFPINIIQDDEKIFIVDFSIDPKEMKELLNITKNIVWIDHHKSAIDKYDKYPEIKDKIAGIRDLRFSGAALTWWYYAKYMNIIPTTRTSSKVKGANDIVNAIETKCPYITKLVDDHDCWKGRYSDSMPLKEGIEMEEANEPWDALWDSLNSLEVKAYNRVLNNGKLAIKYRNSLSNYAMEMTSREYELEGLKCLIMNIPFKGSPWFGDKIDKYDAVIPYYFNTKTNTWEYSIYTNKDIDVSLIAQKYGGGGHHSAAGFFTKECLFK